jgi:dTMP kinase
LFPAALAVALLGACAGTSYVTGFTVLQETVQDDMRGRIFATLYTVIRMCLLVALVISPLWADLWDWIVNDIAHVGVVSLGQVDYAFPGVRIALWCGGLITLGAGLYARWSMKHADPLTVGSDDVAPDAAA